MTQDSSSRKLSSVQDADNFKFEMVLFARDHRLPPTSRVPGSGFPTYYLAVRLYFRLISSANCCVFLHMSYAARNKATLNGY